MFAVSGSFTLKKEDSVKRALAKRKIVSVPELLSERTELTNRADQMKTGSNEEPNEFEEFLILNKPEPEIIVTNNVVKSEINETEPASSTECLKILNTPLTSNNSSISYSFSKSSVLVVTADGNYVITSLANDVPKKPVAPPQIEQVIILNSNDIQFAEMEVDCQDADQIVDEKG